MEKLGIQPSVLITQVINFAILAALLWKFLYKPVTKTLDARKKQIESDLQLSQSLKEQELELDATSQKTIKAAHLEAQEIIAAAKKEAKDLHQTEVDLAKADIAKERAKLIAEVDAYTEKQRTKLSQEAIILATSLTKKVLSDSLDPKSQDQLIKASLAKFSKLDAK